MPPAGGFRGGVDRIGGKACLIWAGLSIGVAFLATPAKFLAPSLSLSVALDVGRQTFRTYNGVELAICGVLVLLGLGSRARLRWYLLLAVPGLIVVAQTFLLLPPLDLRVAAIQAGGPPPLRSALHAAYIATEAVKVLWLLGLGLGDALSRASGRGRRLELVALSVGASRPQ